MMDNMAFQPGRGNWIIHEDGDGPDASAATTTSGTAWRTGRTSTRSPTAASESRTLNDLTAGVDRRDLRRRRRHFYVSIQHNVTGHGVILKITGWR